MGYFPNGTGEAARIIGEVQPAVVFLENVDGILRYYFDIIRPELQAVQGGV